MRTLFHLWLHPFSRKVRIVLAEKNLEFEDKIENSYPVKIVDYCGVHNEKYDLWDNIEDKENWNFSKNEFLGINCECNEDDTPAKCQHSQSFNDKYALKIITKLLVSQENAKSEKYYQWLKNLFFHRYKKCQSDCHRLKSGCNSR